MTITLELIICSGMTSLHLTTVVDDELHRSRNVPVMTFAPNRGKLGGGSVVGIELGEAVAVGEFDVKPELVSDKEEAIKTVGVVAELIERVVVLE